MKKTPNYKNMDQQTLKKELSTMRAQVLSLRFQIATGDNTEYGKLKSWKKAVARILTQLRGKSQPVKEVNSAAAYEQTRQN